MIICSTCKTSKPDSHFGSSLVHGKKRCLKCGREAVKKSYEKHKEMRVNKSREYRKNNPDAGRDAKFKYKYGIDLVEYTRLFMLQKGKCAICNKKYNKKLDVDHCHDTKKVRGLLCRSCNLGIGQFKHSVAIIDSAVKYLEDCQK